MDSGHISNLVHRVKQSSISTSWKEIDVCFPLGHGNVVYVQGPPSSGKTELLLQILVTCILPKKWGEVDVGGNESSVLYFDNDFKFNLQRVLQLIKSRLKRVRVTEGQPPLQDIGRLVNETTSRLLVCQCYDLLQFCATMRSYLCRATFDNVRYVFVDSFDCFYWQEAAITSKKPAVISSNLALALLTKLNVEKNVSVFVVISEHYSRGVPPNLTIHLKDSVISLSETSVDFDVDNELGFCPKVSHKNDPTYGL